MIRISNVSTDQREGAPVLIAGDSPLLEAPPDMIDGANAWMPLVQAFAGQERKPFEKGSKERPQASENTMAEILTKSANLQGRHLTGLDGVKLGTVREFFVDLASGQIEFLIVEGGGLLGGSGKFHPIPWSAVRYDSVAGAFQAERTKDDFRASPSYDRDQLADAGYAWHEQATRFFAPAPSAP